MFKVAIIGRPNVGKSTLFNKIAGKRIAIVTSYSGVTRDRNEIQTEHFGKNFMLIDSGGIEISELDNIKEGIRDQAIVAINQADLVLLVVDYKDGLTTADIEIAEIARKKSKPIVLAINKVDNPQTLDAKAEFSKLGFNLSFPISAEHSLGLMELLEQIVSFIDETKTYEDDTDYIKIAIVGRPNVGKSSLVNKILRKDRMMVSETAGTTRDAIDSLCKVGSEKFLIIDTAGIRKKGLVSDKLEKFSIVMALKAIERADIVILLLDATKKVSTQDAKIGSIIDRSKKGVIIAVNKWDAIEKDNSTVKKFETEIKSKLNFIRFAPISFISALDGTRVMKLFELVKFVHLQYTKKVGTSKLNQLLENLTKNRNIPSKSHKRARLYYGSQVKAAPPTFLFMANNPESIPASYRKFMISNIREICGFENTPVILNIKQSRGKDKE